MKWIRITCLGMLLCVPVLAAQYPDGDVFYCRALSLRITKPPGWIFEVKEENPVPRNTAVLILRFQEPYAALNPSCRVRAMPLRSLPTRLPSQLAEAQVRQDRKAQQDLIVLEEPKAVKVSGLDGTFFKETYSSKAGADTSKVLKRVYFVANSESMFKITLTGPPDGPMMSDKEFNQIVSSIRIGD